MEEIQGTVKTVYFTSSDDSFTVLRLTPENLSTEITVTLNGKAPLVGQLLKLTGNWVTHPRYGQQFKAASFRLVAPTEAKGIERFLASGAIAGIGPAMAKRIVDKFGDQTLNIIANQSKKLLDIPGIGKKTLEKIHNSYTEQTELTELMLWLESHGISGTYAGKIFKKYGSFAIDIMEKDIYRLAQEVDGIGFLTADKIAQTLGISLEAENRIISGINYALQQISNNGHCCIPEGPLLERTAKLLQLPAATIQEVLSHQLVNGQLNTEHIGGKTLIYPPYLYKAEKVVAEKLLAIQKQAVALPEGNTNLLIKVWENENQITLADNQRQAILASLRHGVLVLTGGPGTGKTTIVKGILSILNAQGLKIRLAAPTGRAAKRLSETSGRTALTIHRLLESGIMEEENTLGFAKNADDPLDTDVIILDEVSMIDIVLMQHLVEAIPDGCRLILVGDIDQLPAVGPGSVLKDIIRSQKIPAIKLTEIFRQAHTSMIIENAHIINKGRIPDLTHNYPDFIFNELSDDDAIAARILELCQTILPQQGYDARRDIQILSPMHRLTCGVENLNQLLQDRLNPSGEHRLELKNGTTVYRLGDKVMHIRNNYQKKVFNGDIGFVVDINDNSLTVDYLGHQVSYERNELVELTLAYASSVHKSQGSEYKVVIMPLSSRHFIMLQRNLLYTAITRAKEIVILLGSKQALYTAIQNNHTQHRYTLLAERLNEAI